MTNSVTFPVNLGGDGSTVTDDDNATTGLGNGGHRTRFVPAMGQVVAVANTLTGRLAAASDTSTTSLTIGIGSVTFTTAKFYTWATGMWVMAAYTSDPTKYMYGQVSSYNSTTGALVVAVNQIGSSGTYANWTISLSVPDASISQYVTKDSTTGSAGIPSGTTAERTATPSSGAFRFNQTLLKFEGYNGTTWGSVGGGGATGGGQDAVFMENDQTVTSSYSITAGKNAGTFGPITINSSVTVTIPSGSVWTVV